MFRSGLEAALKRCSCYSSAPEESLEEDFIKQKIDEDLEKYYKELNKATKLLLLGTGEAGKSTFFKQLHINYGAGFSDEARQEYKRVIHQNIFMAMQSMLVAMDELRISYEKSEHAILANNILTVNVDAVTSLDASESSAIERLWADKGIQQCYNRRREYQLIDSAKYFLDNLNCITQTDYVPTDDDILRSRVCTTGIVEHVFDTQRNRTKRNSTRRLLLRVIDVGGQRSERRKWLQCFDDVTALIFLTSLSEYDQTLSEAKGLNRMEESRNLFRFILSSSYFQRSSIILFLNKLDLLEEKIMTSHLADYYPEYKGPKQNADAAKYFIFQMFKSSVDKDRTLYEHYTCATAVIQTSTRVDKRISHMARAHLLFELWDRKNTKTFRIVLLAVQNTIMDLYFESIGIN